MAKPKVFVSSTFHDLRHIRSSLENFIESLGYEPILSEKGSVVYNPELALDESCYREVESCDIFVLIIGSRYGSAKSTEKKTVMNDFFYRYESITKMEYESASKKDIPTYIVIEKNVYSEYDTFINNRENESIKYAHVDSINIFHLIDKIFNQPRNNPIHTFEKHQEIEYWLKEQWSGLFRDMLQKRSEKSQLTSLSKQVNEMAEINTTLKRYLEEVVSKVSKDDAVRIIEDEEKRLQESKIELQFKENGLGYTLLVLNKISLKKAKQIVSDATCLEDLARSLQEINKSLYDSKLLVETWKKHQGISEQINQAREILGLHKLDFSEKS